MQCAEWEESISQFIDGTLSDEASKRLMTHLETCEDCKACFDESLEIAKSLRDMPMVEVPEDFHAGISRMIRAEAASAKTFVWKRASLFAACVLGFLVVASGLFSLVGSGAGRARNDAMMGNYSMTDAVADLSESAKAQAYEAYELAEGDTFTESSVIISALPESTGNAGIMSEAPRVSSVEPIVANRVTFVISAEVEDIDQALEATKLIAGSTDTSNVNLGSNKSASMTRRVEFADYEAAKVALRELGEVNYEEETVVSYQSMLVETKARISAKETEKERLEALLGKSNTMDVMIRVDSQLSSVITQYEQQVSQLRSIEDTVGRAYLDVNIYEAYKPQEAVKASFKDRLAGGFIGSFNATTEFMENFVIFVSGAIVPLLVIAVIAILIVAIVRLAKKRGSGR